jgi:lipoate-protein ligase B
VDLTVLPLRRLPYTDALEEQLSLADAVRSDPSKAFLMLVEHDPVFTLGKNAQPGNLLQSIDALRSDGFDVHEIDRGGDVTYHGPGQLVGYPIFHIQEKGWGVRDYICRLEKCLEAVCRNYRISVSRQSGSAGLWAAQGKIAAIGIRIDRRVTRHGFALNVDLDLTAYDRINPCGQAGAAVTDISRMSGDKKTVAEVATVFESVWLKAF